MRAAETFVALVHHPVYDRAGRVVTTGLTSMDLHDLARSCRTYGLGGLFVVHPAPAQRVLAERILGHWTEGQGADRNDFRRQAFERVHLCASVAEAEAEVERRTGSRPVCVGTAARDASGTIQYDKEKIQGPALLLFGTGHGLTDELLASCGHRLAPLRGPTDYNHLSVRSACAIVLDRLYGLRQE